MIPSHLQCINKCVIFYVGATRIAVRLNFSYNKKKQLTLGMAVASFVLCIFDTVMHGYNRYDHSNNCNQNTDYSHHDVNCFQQHTYLSYVLPS